MSLKELYLHIHINFNEYKNLGFGATELEIKNNKEKYHIKTLTENSILYVR